MSKYYSEGVTLAAGHSLPALEKEPTRVGVVLFCAAIRNFHRLHYDEGYTKLQNIDDVLVPGFQMGNWCIEAATRSFPPDAIVRRLKFKNTQMAYIGSAFRVEGHIVAVREDGEDGKLATCEFQVRDKDARVVTTASLEIAFRS